MGFGDKEGNAPLSDQRNVGEGQFFWAAAGEGAAKSLSSTFQARANKLHEVISYIEEAGNHLECSE